MEERQVFFEKIMLILDEAKGDRDTTYGPFSFLWKNSYVRNAVVSSFDTTTSITGLKMYLAMNVLGMHASGNASRMSYEQLRALLSETSSKKYSINYNTFDECMDIKKNVEAIRDRLYTPELLEKSKESLEYLEKTDELFPYLLMDKLRNTVWSKLRNFFELCKQNVCSECSKKSMIYFQFIQAVALYEIFYIRLIQENAADYLAEETDIINEAREEANRLNELIGELNDSETGQSVKLLYEVQESVQGLNDRINDKVLENIYHIEVYQLMLIEFGISLNAMCYLLMIFEAMQVCSYEMKGLQHLSLEIEKKLRDIYDRDLAMLIKSNHKRATRYRSVNKRIEKLLEHQYPECNEYDAVDTIYTFMSELCKPIREQNKIVLRGLEIMLGYPIYHEQTEGNTESDAKG